MVNYEKALVLTQQVVHKILDFMKADVGQAEMKLLTQAAQLDGKGAPSDPDLFFQQLIHYGMAFFRNARGQTLTDRWREKGFVGLTNDERVAAEGYGRSYVSVLEVQDIGPGGQLWMVDVLRPASGRFLVIDRAAASSVHRFTLLLSWYLPLPHYTRISGVTGVHVPREMFEPWRTDLSDAYQSALRTRPGLTREEHLASTVYLQLQRLKELGEEWQASILRGMDFCRAIARFTLNAPEGEIAKILDAKPDFERTEARAGDGFDKPSRQYLWLRRGESKAVEKEMNQAFQHADSDEAVGGLATLRLYPDRLVLETFSRQKYDFARQLLDQWFGTQLRFEAESIEDLAKIMAERKRSRGPSRSPASAVSPFALFAGGSKSPEARQVPKSRPIPPEQTRQALRRFYEDRYRRFAEEPVPMLGNITPREAARKPELRPRLIELLKVHIHGIEETNRKDGIQISLDWLLDELGVPELRARG